MRLAEREVAAEDVQAGFAEGGRQTDEKCRLAVSSGTVGKDEAIPGGACWYVEETTNRRLSGVVTERRYVRLAHRN
jgi:hypothetical protein